MIGFSLASIKWHGVYGYKKQRTKGQHCLRVYPTSFIAKSLSVVLLEG